MTLFIFSFDKLRAAMRLPLRKHLWHAWLAITLIAIMTCASTVLSTFDTSIPPTYRHHDNLEQKEIALLGDSQLASIRESALVFPAKNMAGGGTAYPIQYALLKHFGPQMPKLRTVLIGYNNIMLRNPDIDRRKGDYRTILALGLPWYDIPISWRERIEYAISYQDYFKPLLVGPRPAIKHLEEWSFLKKADAAEKESNVEARASLNVYEVNTVFSYAPVNGSGKVRGYMNAYSDDEIDQKNRQAFFGILKYCFENNIEAVLLRNPTTQGYRGARSEAWNQALVDLLAEARTKFPGLPLPVWDAERTEYFPLELFSDPNHMWADGNARFADYINLRLQEQPYRDDSSGLAYHADENHIVATDPRDHLWAGLDGKENLIARVPVPDEFQDTFNEAFQVTLPPGGHLRQSDIRYVIPGDQVTGGIWLWANKTADTQGLHISVFRDGAGPISGSSVNAAKLDEQPRLYTVTHTFTQAHPAARLQITNPTDQAITFIMAAPSLTR